MTTEPWYATHFDESYLRAYRPLLPPEDVPHQVDFIVRELRLEPGMRVLDLCCGQGRHAVPLALRGLRVAGLDLSEYLLGEARRAAEDAGVKVEFVRGDMREIPWTGEFDAAVSMFTAFGYFDDDAENQRVLEGVARALKDGGRLCMDLLSYTWLMRNWETKGWWRGEGDLLVFDDRRVDWMRGIQEADRTFIEPDGQVRTVKLRLRLLTSHELVDWLRRAGLETEALFGDFTGAPYGLESKRLIAVARKG